jgi:hypothetical protein
MQKRKTEISLIAAALAALLSGCGPSATPATREPTHGADQAADLQPAKALACASSDDCANDMICVDGECMIPKLAR